MAVFTDNAGRAWPIDVTIGTIKRVRSQLAINLIDLSKECLEQLYDPVVLCDLLWLICQDLAKEREITEEEFGGALAGDAIASATQAFLEALADFFPTEKAALLKRSVKVVNQVNETDMRLVAEQIETFQQRLEKADNLQDLRQLLETLGNISGGAQVSSESTPTP